MRKKSENTQLSYEMPALAVHPQKSEQAGAGISKHGGKKWK